MLWPESVYCASVATLSVEALLKDLIQQIWPNPVIVQADLHPISESLRLRWSLLPGCFALGLDEKLGAGRGSTVPLLLRAAGQLLAARFGCDTPVLAGYLTVAELKAAMAVGEATLFGLNITLAGESGAFAYKLKAVIQHRDFLNDD